jgi:hypothetical protein
MSSIVYSPIIFSADSPTPVIPSVNIVPGAILAAPYGVIQMPYVSPTLPPHLDVNQNPETWKMVSKYYYYRTLDDWLWDDNEVKDVLNYLRITDKGADVLNNLNDYKESNINKDNQNTYEMKVNFIEKNVLSIDNMITLLKRFVKETGIKWVDLAKNHYFIKDLVKKYLKQKLQYMIESKLSKK